MKDPTNAQETLFPKPEFPYGEDAKLIEHLNTEIRIAEIRRVFQSVQHAASLMYLENLKVWREVGIDDAA